MSISSNTRKNKLNNNNIYNTPATPLIRPHFPADVDRITGIVLTV